MRINQSPVEGMFLERPNRFLVQALIDGREQAAHLADPGRLRELLLPRARLVLQRESGEHRKTAFTVFLVRHEEVWVCIDTRMPNRVAEEALVLGQLAPFRGYAHVQREVRRGRSRFDFCLSGRGQPPCWIEVKSVSLVEGRRALFPDAPTARGARHMHELAEIAAAGERAAVLFLIQRRDAEVFSPHAERDPLFAQALREAAARGVEVYAYVCSIEPGELAVEREVPAELAGPPGDTLSP